MADLALINPTFSNFRLDRLAPEDLNDYSIHFEDTYVTETDDASHITRHKLDFVPIRDPPEESNMTYYERPLNSRSYTGSHMRGMHELPFNFPDTDSGFSSRSQNFAIMDDYQNEPHSLVRTRSMNKLNGSVCGESVTSSSPTFYSSRTMDRTMRDLKDNFDDSENRRVVLVHKLKEAQDTLELQSNRLSKIESLAKDNTMLVEDLKQKEKEYRRRIAELEKTHDDKDSLRSENSRLREQMQDRIDALDYQLKALKTQHQSSESANAQRGTLLDETTQTLSMMEAENARLQREKRELRDELNALKDSLHAHQGGFDNMERENRELKGEISRIRDDNIGNAKKLHDSAAQIAELQSMAQSMQIENERLATAWKTLAEEKQRISRELEGHHDNVSDIKALLARTSSEKDRLYHDKIEQQHKIQQLTIDKEQLLKTKEALEDELEDNEAEIRKIKSTKYKKDDEKTRLEDELQAVKKVSEDLSSELSAVKAQYESALEQNRTLENSSKLSQQQFDLFDQEKRRLIGEIDRLKEQTDGKNKELRRDKEQLEDTIMEMKTAKSLAEPKEMADQRYLKQENNHLEDRNRELETKLNKANDDLRSSAGVSQNELDTWKATCNRLTAAVSNKERELQGLSDKCHDMDQVNHGLMDEIKILKEKCEDCLENNADFAQLKEENRMLQMEKAENEQFIKLLEMQKEVLSKSNESSLNKLHDVEELSGKLEDGRKENLQLRDKVADLEKVRDKLVKQKEEVLANTDLIYKTPAVEQLRAELQQLKDSNEQLRDVNDNLADKLDYVEQEKRKLRDDIQRGTGPDGELITRDHFDQVQSGRKRAEEDYDRLRQDYEDLKGKHQEYMNKHGAESTKQEKDELRKLKKEKNGLEKQVQLINGQLVLVEGSKKRLDSVVDKLQNEIKHLRKELEEAQKHPIEVERLKKEIEILQKQLDDNELSSDNQQRMLKKLKEDSVEDELTQMQDELQTLMKVIEGKDQEIMKLETKLKLDESQERISPNRSFTTERGRHDSNNEDKDSLDANLEEYARSMMEREGELAQRLKPGGNPLTLSKIPTPLQEVGKTRPGHYGTKFFSKSEEAEEKGNGKLQSLISKYRDSEPASMYPDRKVKPFSASSSRMGLVTKGRSFGPSAPKDSSQVSATGKDPVDDHVQPASATMTEAKSKTMDVRGSSLKLPGATSDYSEVKSGGEVDKQEFDDRQEQKDINTLIQKSVQYGHCGWVRFHAWAFGYNESGASIMEVLLGDIADHLWISYRNKMPTRGFRPVYDDHTIS